MSLRIFFTQYPIPLRSSPVLARLDLFTNTADSIEHWTPALIQLLTSSATAFTVGQGAGVPTLLSRR